MENALGPMSRVVEESVPGKQVTIAHVIASPVPEIYECLGIEGKGAIGILTLSPFETSMIAADLSVDREMFEAAIPEMAERAMEDNCTVTNPRTPNQSDIENLYKNLCKGGPV